MQHTGTWPSLKKRMIVPKQSRGARRNALSISFLHEVLSVNEKRWNACYELFDTFKSQLNIPFKSMERIGKYLAKDQT